MTLLAGICLLALLVALGGCLYRLATGPRALDRVLAFDLAGVLVAAAVAVFAVLQQSWAYLEISMGLAVLAFAATVALAYYVERGRFA